VGTGLAEQLVDVWLETECTEPRHLKRVAMFSEQVTEPSADVPLSDQDIERVVTRLQDIIGPMNGAEPSGETVGENPEAAREFVRLGATGLTSVALAEKPGNIPGDLTIRYSNPTQLKNKFVSSALRRLSSISARCV
jgi:hypothetical protein